MVIEHALLSLKPGADEAFTTAFDAARPLIASMPGYCGLTLSRCMERPNSYLLLVEWDRIEDHTEGFRGSVEYQQWCDLLHHFYDPMPSVEHFQPVGAH